MSDTPFIIHSPFQPMGDQPHAIEELVESLDAGRRHQVLLGATGTGKTFTMANVIARRKPPAPVRKLGVPRPPGDSIHVLKGGHALSWKL